MSYVFKGIDCAIRAAKALPDPADAIAVAFAETWWAEGKRWFAEFEAGERAAQVIRARAQAQKFIAQGAKEETT